MLFEIWQSRNNNKNDKNLLPQHTLISKTNAQLHSSVQTHYKKHKLNDTLDLFKDQFYINEAIAKIENDLLKTLLT